MARLSDECSAESRLRCVLLLLLLRCLRESLEKPSVPEVGARVGSARRTCQSGGVQGKYKSSDFQIHPLCLISFVIVFLFLFSTPWISFAPIAFICIVSCPCLALPFPHLRPHAFTSSGNCAYPAFPSFLLLPRFCLHPLSFFLYRRCEKQYEWFDFSQWIVLRSYH
ncbi:hypothetical protein BDP27DRAFT_513748 [Rhodocollybia butyracea]|uniref:Secreted protein n=1 Tax=Rhodocollybia butyracea TaxID=206335 RepID=A0A9P5P9M8_9AGAR|nr:hypothetical protein BDP27DRAFT_513748 [Rhodocollybia butyracea]